MRNIVKVRLATASLAVLALAACREDEARTLSAAVEPAPIGYGAAGMSLPYAEPARVAWYEPERGYDWAERAYGLQRAFYDAPPDYGFDYGPYDPWVWEAEDDGFMYAEPWGEDGYLYYYYEPEAAYPYFVRDAQYGYGFDPEGVLVALFDPSGNYLPVDRYQAAAPLAGRYFAHGRELRRAALGTARLPIDRAAWERRAPAIRDAGAAWVRVAESKPEWKAWRAKDDRRRVASLGPMAREREAGHRPDEHAKAHPRRDEARPVPPGHARHAERGERRPDKAEARHARAAGDRGRPASFEDRGNGRAHQDRGGERAKPENHGGHGKPQGGGPDHGGGHGKGEGHPGGGAAQDHGGGHGKGGGHDGGKGGGKKG